MTQPTKKVVINACYGGFSLSAFGVKRYAELQGRPCYFFVSDLKPGGGGFADPEQVTIEEASSAFMFSAFDQPEYPKTLEGEAWHAATMEERQASNAEYERHQIEERGMERHDPLLVQVVEELGEKANGKCAELKVVEIPADVEYVIEEYDGYEHIAEAHRTWN